MTIDVNILHDTKFKQAVTAIQKRAERQLDYSKIIDIFVHTDLFTRSMSTDTQLILGRRGTGKTHIIKVFAYNRKLKGEHVILLDCTQFGSGISSIRDLDDSGTAAKYFTAFLNQLGTELLDTVAHMENPEPEVQERLYTKLTTLSSFIEVNKQSNQPTFNYRQLRDSLDQILNDLQISRLFILLDEWAHIPVASQTFFAEFLKRSIIPIYKISLKIVAVNYQCEFFKDYNGQPIGLQRGADITDILEIDTYLIYDIKREQVIKFFGQVLYNHLGAELGWDLKLSADEKFAEIQSLFTQSGAFLQLVRAAEGNCRDFLCIFSRAYYDGFLHTPDAKRINIQNVETASASWFDSEKQSNIKVTPKVQHALVHIFEKVIKGYRSRTFMVESTKADHPILLRLLNERVLHKLNVQYAHKQNPGVRYELFTLDFGAYIKFKGTDNEPKEPILTTEIDGKDSGYMVPIDDKRSVRRIVLDPDTFDVKYEQLSLQL
jgi:hypothetical protein